MLDAVNDTASFPALTTYWDTLASGMKALGSGPATLTPPLIPFRLPHLDRQISKYLETSRITTDVIGHVENSELRLLNLMSNPNTRTTKTFASLVMVARAINYIRETGRRVFIVTPTSANKGTALRDAVWRAYECGLATPFDLRIAIMAPEQSSYKLWQSGLDTSNEMARKNPVAVYTGAEPSTVKAVAAEVVEAVKSELAVAGVDVWYSLDIDNYRTADAVRFLYEREHFPRSPTKSRLHVHSVSSAYGLLGHDFGVQVHGRESDGGSYFLVQHLGTPDMVLSLLNGHVDRNDIPKYRKDAQTGSLRQDVNPHFPATTAIDTEVLDPTFYTRSPVTSTAINTIIERRGGGGIVVSKQECLALLSRTSELLARANVLLPANPDDLREWSLIMAMTGTLLGLKRGLITQSEVIIHGTGLYTTNDYEARKTEQTHKFSDAPSLKTGLADFLATA